MKSKNLTYKFLHFRKGPRREGGGGGVGGVERERERALSEQVAGSLECKGLHQLAG